MKKSFVFPLLTLLSLYGLVAQADCPSWSSVERFSLNANGDEVTDNSTGLVWKRCSEGNTWTVSICAGAAGIYTHEQALALAKTANSTDSATGWRLPNAKELSSLIDEGCQNPALDSTVLPTPSGNFYSFWSSSPYAGDSTQAWRVAFGTGSILKETRSNTYHVRLVRSSQ